MHDQWFICGALLVAETVPVLSHLNKITLHAKLLPHTMQLKTIGTSYFAIIDSLAHSASHSHYNQWPSPEAAQPHKPDASICSTISRVFFFWLEETDCMLHAARCPLRIRLPVLSCVTIILWWLGSSQVYLKAAMLPSLSIKKDPNYWLDHLPSQ